MSLIKGIHHVALRPTYAQFEKAKTFYLDLLGLKVVRRWGDEKYPCMMISTGDNSCIEVLPVPEENDVPPEGKFAHLALATDDTDGCVARVRDHHRTERCRAFRHHRAHCVLHRPLRRNRRVL